MLAIDLRFPGGRYHATPWDHHVNEGIVEWPPSPWRVLRALIATWHRKLPELPEEAVRRLVHALAASPPVYSLPETAPAHTRHYMPPYSGNTTKVFDTFLHVGQTGSLQVRWPDLILDAEDEQTLDRLLEVLNYLGRAESWVEAARVSVARPATALPAIGEAPNEAFELISVLVPVSDETYANFRREQVERDASELLERRRQAALAKGKSPPAKLTSKDRAAVEAALPEALFGALQCDTNDLRREGWSQPPGSQWLQYYRRIPAPRVLRSSVPRSRSEERPTVARVLVVSKVPPRLTTTVYVAERLRGRLLRGQLPIFAGKDEQSAPRLGHDHAFILPEANGRGPGHVTHVTLYAPMGFDDAARALLEDLRSPRSSSDTLQFMLLGLGHPEDFAGSRLEAGQSPLLDTCTTWVSRTPFAPTRHPKTTRAGIPKLDANGVQIGSPEHDLRRLLQEALDLPSPLSVAPVEGTLLGGKPTPWRAFSLERNHGGGRKAGFRGYGFRITFPEPVRGPIAVGYGAHFGLGVFAPAGVFDSQQLPSPPHRATSE